jgi:hypothetical protein
MVCSGERRRLLRHAWMSQLYPDDLAVAEGAPHGGTQGGLASWIGSLAVPAFGGIAVER